MAALSVTPIFSYSSAMEDEGEVPAKQLSKAALSEAHGLRERIVSDASIVFVTLVSVLVGLVLADLVAEARGRMRLWPPDLPAMLTWAQLIGTGLSAVSVWMVFAHLGILRRRMPQLSEAIACLGPPLLLLVANNLIGREQAWPWFYGAGVYLIVCSLTFTVLVRQAMDQPGGFRFARMLRPNGCLLVLVAGAPTYLVCGLLDQQGRMGGGIELAVTLTTLPATFVVDWIFFRDLKAALDGPATGQ